MTENIKPKRPFDSVLKRNPDLFQFKTLLLLKPMNHFFLGLYMDPGRSFKYFSPTIVKMPIFTGMGVHSHTNPRVDLPGVGLFYWAETETMNALRDLIHDRILPDLRNTNTFENFIMPECWFTRGRQPSLEMSYVHLEIEIARADLEAADRIAQEHILNVQLNNWQMRNEQFLNWMRRKNRTVELLAARDISGLVNILRESEQRSIALEKLEKYWEPTPFPLEQLL